MKKYLRLSLLHDFDCSVQQLNSSLPQHIPHSFVLPDQTTIPHLEFGALPRLDGDGVVLLAVVHGQVLLLLQGQSCFLVLNRQARGDEQLGAPWGCGGIAISLGVLKCGLTNAPLYFERPSRY